MRIKLCEFRSEESPCGFEADMVKAVPPAFVQGIFVQSVSSNSIRLG